MYICICNGVTDSQIRAAVDAGATSIRQLNQQLSVGNCCGKCTKAAKDVMNQHLDRLQEKAFNLDLGYAI